MYPWFLVMYAVVQIGSVFFRSAWGTILRTEPACAVVTAAVSENRTAVIKPKIDFIIFIELKLL